MTKVGPVHLERHGKAPVIALPKEVYEELSAMKQPKDATHPEVKEPFYSLIQRLISHYRAKP